jgi:hypothetical protein
MDSRELDIPHTDHFVGGGKIMTNPDREREIHPSARPLWDAFQAGPLTRVDVMRQLRLNSRQVVSNWLRDGIPSRHIAGVARVCGISPEEYRARAGLESADDGVMILPARRDIEQLVGNYQALPPAMQAYVLRRIKEARQYLGSLPEFLHEGAGPPAAPDKLREWEVGFFAAMEKHALAEHQAADTEEAAQ